MIPTTKQEQFKIELYKKVLKKIIRESNLITFDMLCYNTCALFEKDDEVIRKYKQKYKHIAVDEFQDTDPRQFKFVASFGEGTSVLFVADALQCIYQFRGCTNTYVKQLSSTPNWQVIKMPKNYRSTRQICEFANKFSKTYAEDRYRIEMEGQRDGDPVEVVRGAHASFESEVDRRHLDDLVKRLKVLQEPCAILCRTNKEVQCVCEKLEEENIVFSKSSKTSETLDFLRSILDDEYWVNWLASNYLNASQYGEYMRLSIVDERNDIQWFLDHYKSVTKVWDRSEKIIKCREILLDEFTSIEDRCDKIIKKLKMKNMEGFEISSTATARELVEGLIQQAEKQEEEKIYVGTIHSSKGLEYDTVFLMGVNDRSFE